MLAWLLATPELRTLVVNVNGHVYLWCVMVVVLALLDLAHRWLYVVKFVLPTRFTGRRGAHDALILGYPTS